jgi:DNA-binding transcriptional LysR family regulator
MIVKHTDASFEASQSRWLDEQHILPKRSKLEVNDISACLSMISEGIGWALLPEICLSDFASMKKPLFFRDGSAFTRATHLLYKEYYRELPQVDRFIREITD